MTTIRRVRDVDDLVATFDAIGRQFDPPMAAPDRRLDQPLARFPDDRPLQLAVVGDDGGCGGGVIAFRHADDLGSVTVRAIGIDVELRGAGLGRRLLEIVELEAMALGCRSIHLGADEDARGFYEALGYRGKRSMRAKDLPAPGRLTDRLVARARAALGDPDLAVGLNVTPRGDERGRRAGA